MTVLDVRPVGYGQAARTVGGELAGTLELSRDVLVSSLASCTGMAGSDDIGRSWANGYDAAAAGAVSAFTDLVDAAYTVGALLEQCGINYAGAEAACVPGETAAQTQARYSAARATQASLPPSADGAGAPPPNGWALLQHLINRLWPNGHQDRLHHAADAWYSARDSLYCVLPDLAGAIAEVREQRAPEVDDAVAVMTRLSDHADSLAIRCRMIGDACSSYAHELDHAHSAIIHELVTFVDESAGAEVAGGVLAAFTFGASELAAQGAVYAAALASSRAITAAIDVLRVAVVPLARGFDAVTTELAALRDALAPILARSPRAASVVHPGVAGQVAPAVAGGWPALGRLGRYAEGTYDAGGAGETWADLRWLPEHFEKHRAEFGMRSAEEYARAAARFRSRVVERGVHVKVDELTNTVRLYDPGSNTLGSYRLSDWKTRTYFRPKQRMAYWNRQPGVTIK